MNVDVVTQPAAQQAASTAGTTASLGRDEFLKLLVAKLENQDPLRPAEDTEFVAQLATFSSLEQLIQVNDNLESLAAAQTDMVNARALDLIGREALIEAGGQIRIHDGQPDSLVYVIPRQAREATLSIVADGQVVHTLELDPTPRGRVSLDWDGTYEKDGETVQLEDGSYEIRVNVTDANGDPMAIGLYRALTIDGVSFYDGAISLVSGDTELPFDRILEIRAGHS